MVQPGDTVIIISYAMMSSDEIKNHKPTVVFVNESNQPKTTMNKEVHATII
ncbi:Aspartate 1-decarboxylase precursor [compost metagenome]